VTVDYQLRFGWIYTGASDSYREYTGSEIFETPNDGLPVHTHEPPASTVIPFKRYDGETCVLYIGPHDGAVDCPDDRTMTRRGKRGYAVATKVLRIAPDHYRIFAAPEESELEKII
jgi:hypothetical protein